MNPDPTCHYPTHQVAPGGIEMLYLLHVDSFKTSLCFSDSVVPPGTEAITMRVSEKGDNNPIGWAVIRVDQHISNGCIFLP